MRAIASSAGLVVSSNILQGMAVRLAVALLLLITPPFYARGAGPSYRVQQHRRFTAAYDDLIAKLNAFGDAYEKRTTPEIPAHESEAVRKAWKKLISVETWFREPATAGQNPSAMAHNRAEKLQQDVQRTCPAARNNNQQVRRTYAAFIYALNRFAERYVANHANLFPAEDAAAVRRSWQCLIAAIPAFDETSNRR
jgi:hypothetical protein